jgi:hypothetical protein
MVRRKHRKDAEFLVGGYRKSANHNRGTIAEVLVLRILCNDGAQTIL